MRRRRSLIAALFVAGLTLSAVAPAVADPTPFPLGACARVRLVRDEPICVYIDPSDDTTTATRPSGAR